MTIRQFAKLCGCNPQTLRYYDHVDLLKPVKVDEWSGYRYYEEDQALAFVKIKNLQKAGFSIEEIKELLDKDNQAIYEAFELKIAEEEKRLQEIKEIQRSYHTEMDQMKTKVEEIKVKILSAMAQYDAAEEFDILDKTYQGLIDKIEALDSGDMDKLNLEETNSDTVHHREYLNDPDYELVYEKHGWDHVKEFFDEFSELEDGADYVLCFQKTGEEDEHIPISIIVLNMLLDKNPGKQRTLGCDMEKSEDGLNHFWMFKKK